ncbi:hypothetical protein [Hymenobacter swuensis]|uniref:Uncharacterized protein n=1 Tax=Hymenobacter swuensis DY53 TaxID=1227739 RepID=W8F2N1_9BACT|nr:hypothetical protein [Hymenobacter swuensis]AHJ99654.1 hypothetical protein Hsw_4059 [Hymenobacter swuensis DY53]
MEEQVLCRVWKTVRIEAGPQPFQGYWSMGEGVVFDFSFLNQTPELASPALRWIKQAGKIVQAGNEAALHLLIKTLTSQHLTLELHMLYSGEARHTLTLHLVPVAA